MPWPRRPSTSIRRSGTSSTRSGRFGPAAAMVRPRCWPRATGAAWRWPTRCRPAASRSRPSPPASTGSRRTRPRRSRWRPSGPRPPLCSGFAWWPSTRTRSTYSRRPLAGNSGGRRIPPERDELRRADVAAAADDRHLPAGEPPGVAQHGGERGRAGRLDQVARLLDHHPRGVPQRVVRDQDEVAEPLPQDPLRELERGPGRQPFRERARSVLDERAGLPGPVGGRRRLGLHADDLDRPADGAGHDAGARGPAAPAHRHDDHFGVRLLLEDLEGVRGHPRDQGRLVPGVDVAVALLGGLLLAVLAGVVEITA